MVGVNGETPETTMATYTNAFTPIMPAVTGDLATLSERRAGTAVCNWA